jgi:coenzyme F420-reducing hydrogenase delta subunit
MEAFSSGIEGVLVVGCRLEDCHYISGIYETLKTVPAAQRILEKIGINPERLRLQHTSAAEAMKFVEVVTSFTSTIAKLGSLELNNGQKEKLWELRQRKETREKKGKTNIADSSSS